MSRSPDADYSDYRIIASDPERSCINCAKYKPRNDKLGVCYEFEVLPEAGCKFFEEKIKK